MPLFPGKLFTDALTDSGNQHRIARRIRVDFPRHRPDVHPCVMIGLISPQHVGNLCCRKAHVNLKLCGDIPWAIILMLLFGAQLQLQILDIIYPCKYHGMKSRHLIPLQIIPPDLCQEIKKYLIVRCTVNLVDHQHNGLWRSPAHPAQPDEQLVQAAVYRLIRKLLQRLPQIFPAVCPCQGEPLQHSAGKNTHKCGLVRKVLRAHQLEIKRQDDIFLFQIPLQCIQGRGFSILPPSVYDEIFPFVNQLRFNPGKPVVKPHHIMLFRSAYPFCIEMSHPLFASNVVPSIIIRFHAFSSYHNDIPPHPLPFGPGTVRLPCGKAGRLIVLKCRCFQGYLD